MSSIQTHIIALGGGGFSMGNGITAIDRYILARSRSRKPAICFLGTATGDAETYIARFHDAFGKVRCSPSHIGFFERTPDLAKHLLAQDIIYVGGGNTRSMLAVWREWGMPKILRQAWRNGTVLCGISAGAICWFKQGLTDSGAGHLAPLAGLGFLPGSCSPHYDGEAERRPAMQQFVGDRSLVKGIGLDDGAAAHFIGRTLHRVVSERTGARGYEVRRTKRGVVETALPVKRLKDYL